MVRDASSSGRGMWGAGVLCIDGGSNYTEVEEKRSDEA